MTTVGLVMLAMCVCEEYTDTKPETVACAVEKVRCYNKIKTSNLVNRTNFEACVGVDYDVAKLACTDFRPRTATFSL